MHAQARLAAALLAAGLVLAARPAHAEDWFHVDQCDTLTLGPYHAEHVVFSVHNNDATRALRGISFAPVLHESIVPCRVFVLAAPSGWQPVANPEQRPEWQATPAGGGLAPGATKSGFEMTLDAPACCFDVTFTGADATVILGEVSACIECPSGATPTRASTWGSLKVLYR